MDRTRLLLLLLLVGGLIAVVVVTELARGANVSSPSIEQTGFRWSDESPLSGMPEDRALEPTKPETITEPVTTVEQPELPAVAETSAKVEAELNESVHTPVYGAAVQRSGAVATFKLLDAKDQPLFNESVNMELWRRVGVRWIPDEVYFDLAARTIRCDGLSGLGLEPGEYELEVRTPHYGSLRHTFNISKGEQLEGIVRMATWRRIICFHFKQHDGQTVEWIRGGPHVYTSTDPLEPADRLLAPGKVLRDPPPTSGSGGRGGKGGFAYRRARGGGTEYFITATDEGRFYAPVIAGANNEVLFNLGEPWGTSQLRFEETFTGPEWDGHEVTLDLIPDFEEITAEWRRLGTGDPGDRSLLGWVNRELNPPTLDDAESLTRHRLILELEAPPGAFPVYGIQPKDGGAYKIDRAMSIRDGLYYVDGRPGETVWFALRLDGQLCTEKESVAFPIDQPTGLHRIQRKLELKQAATPKWNMTPTIDAWAAHRSLLLVHFSALVDLERNPYVLSPALVAGLSDAEPDAFAMLDWRVAPAAPRSWFSGTWRGEWQTVTQSVEWQEMNAAQCLDVLTTGALKPPAPTGVILRAIGPSLEGLPWAEASIVPYEQDQRAQRLREVETELAAASIRPSLGVEFGDRYHAATDEFGEDKIDAAEMEKHLGAEFLKATSDSADLAYYARNGAWYETRNKLKSDSLGYMEGLNWSLDADKLYVIYLWSNSRDDLKPDARIVFRAAAGMTDLGAISLPTYSK